VIILFSKQTGTNSKVDEKSEHMSLNKFLNQFTSQDNASFEQLQDESTQKHLEKIEFLSKDSTLHNERVQNALALPSIEVQALAKIGNSTQLSGDRLVSWKYSAKNSVMFDPDGAPLTREESAKLKPGTVVVHENTRFKSRPFTVVASQISTDKAQNPLKHGKIGVDGKEVNHITTPNVNGFKFVPSTPSLAPDSLPDSPLMTWGK